jgi:hypothetical protein
VRLRPDLPLVAALLLLAVAPAPLPVRAAQVAATPTEAQLDRAVEAVKADPNISTERTVRQLTWKGDEPRERKRSNMPSWLAWIGDLFAWIAQISMLLVWVLLAGLAALLIIFLARLFGGVKLAGTGTRFVAPTHVQDLDIRPESLPPDIGAAARALWDRDEHRAALALLYRGLLSRLAHVHEIPIRDSSTEGDCLALAARTLDATRTAYATQLVRTWQRAIYGGLTIDAAEFYELCAGFAANLDAPALPESPHRASFASGAPA